MLLLFFSSFQNFEFQNAFAGISRAEYGNSHLCPTQIFATRKRNPDCWASFQLKEGTRLCIPHFLWIQWLTQNTDSPNLCGLWSYKVKYYTIPINEVDHDHLHSSNPKTIRRIYRAVELPLPTTFNVPLLGHLEKHLSWNKFIQFIENAREKNSLLLSKTDSLGVFRQLLIGESERHDPGELFRWLGFVHLLNATGIHLYAIAVFWEKGLQYFFYLIKVPVPIALNLSRMIVFFIWLFTWLLCGARMGMLRPWIVVILQKLGRYLGFKWNKGIPLLLALLLDIIVQTYREPHSLFDPSTHYYRLLYALSVGGGILIFQPNQNPLRGHFMMAIGSWIFTAWLEIWVHGCVALLTPILSYFTIPLVCSFLYPIFLTSNFFAGFHPLGRSMEGILDFCIQSFNQIMVGLTKWEFSISSLWVIPRWSIPLAMSLSILALVASRAIMNPFKKVIFFFIVILLGIGLRFFVPFQLEVHHNLRENFPILTLEQLDVGQGDSTLVTYLAPSREGMDSKCYSIAKLGIQSTFLLPDKCHLSEKLTYHGLIDTGSYWGLSDVDWLKIFASRDITHLEWIALTHLDEDHKGAALRLARLLVVKCMITSEAELNTKRGEDFFHDMLKWGIQVKTWQDPCFPFPTYAPKSAPLPFKPLKRKTNAKRNSDHQNNKFMSAVFLPLPNNGFYLSAGDANANDELAILKFLSYNNLIPALRDRKAGESSTSDPPRILKLSHHGSRFSSSSIFLKALNPSEVWISVGLGNPYGHPAAEVLFRVTKLKIRAKRTDSNGIIRWEHPRYLK